MSAADLFNRSYGRDPDAVFSAPGRVNLIGEHTDYTGGLVLPFAIDARARMAAASNSDNTIRVVSAQRPDSTQSVPLADITPGSPAVDSWAGYVFGAIWALRQQGHRISGFDFALDSAVPSGAGLSSSAAVECVTVLAAATLSGVKLDALEVARLAQLAENEFVGVPCGPMDQTASAAAKAGSVLLFDTAAGTVEHIPFNLSAAGLAVLVLDTTVAHSLADGEYGKRRAACDAATALLGVESLREVTTIDLATTLGRLGDGELRNRVRHVVTENARVAATVTLLRRGHVDDIGPLLTASHDSLRDDYQVSSPELDQAVESALAAGAYGARMTGGGFGGSVIALVPAGQIDFVTRQVRADFAARGFDPPIPRVVEPADGARRDS